MKTYKDIQNRLQFVLTIALFFPVMLDAIFDVVSGKRASDGIIEWGIVVSTLILAYLMLDWVGESLTPRTAKWVDRLLVAEIVMFVPTLFVFRSVAAGWYSDFMSNWPLGICAVLLTFIPLGVAGLLLSNIGKLARF